MTKKKGRPLAQWALNLKSGSYTIEEICRLTGQKWENARKFIRTHAEKTSSLKDEKKQRWIAIYKWENPNGE